MKQRLFVNKQSSGSSTALLSGRCHQLQLCTFLTKGGERFSPSAPNIRSTKDSFKGEELSALPRADLDTWGWGAQGCQCTQTSLLSTQLRWARPAGSFWVTVVITAPPPPITIRASRLASRAGGALGKQRLLFYERL